MWQRPWKTVSDGTLGSLAHFSKPTLAVQGVVGNESFRATQLLLARPAQGWSNLLAFLQVQEIDRLEPEWGRGEGHGNDKMTGVVILTMAATAQRPPSPGLSSHTLDVHGRRRRLREVKGDWPKVPGLDSARAETDPTPSPPPHPVRSQNPFLKPKQAAATRTLEGSLPSFL